MKYLLGDKKIAQIRLEMNRSEFEMAQVKQFD